MRWILLVLIGGGLSAEEVVSQFRCEGKRGVLVFEGLVPLQEYQLGFIGGVGESSLCADSEGKIEVVVYQHDRKEQKETLQIRCGDFSEKIDLEWENK